MNKQGLLSKIEDLEVTRSLDTNTLRDNFYVLKSEVVTIINQLDEPQKVVIPRIVADWLIKAKEWNWSLSMALYMPTGDDYTGTDCHPWMDSYTNQELFAKAWLDGYEVEQEKLYTVEIPNPFCTFRQTHLTRENSGIVLVKSDWFGWKNLKENKLTEAEIKQDFEWALQWAEEVE